MITKIIDFLFPKNCYVNDSNGSWISKNALKEYFTIRDFYRCHVCSKYVRNEFVHFECRESTSLSGLFYVGIYNNLIKELIKDGKYKGFYTIFSDIGEIMAEYLALLPLKSSEFIISTVPMNKRKQKYRGFNQAELIAKKISEITGIKYLDILDRKSNTKTQVGMKFEDRLLNLSGVFQAKNQINKKYMRKKVLLVDDVFTTGSTLEQCANTLIKLGFKEIYGFTFVKSREYDNLKE